MTPRRIDVSTNHAQRLAAEIRDERIRDQAADAYDQMSAELAILGDEQAYVGAEKLANECREFAYIAWRAARAEHLDLPPDGLR